MIARRPKQVRWLKSALRDLEEIVEYIARDNPKASERFADAVFARTETLGQSPHLGSICPHYCKARQLIHGRYLIYYTVHRREVMIRAVVHGARLFRSYWLRRDE